MIILKALNKLMCRSSTIDYLQGGFTLVELLVAIAITGLITAGLSTSIFQIMTINASSTSRMTAIKQVESAVATMRTDVLMAQQIIPDISGGTGFPLTLIRVGWSDNKENTITFSLNEYGELVRHQTVTDLNNPHDPGESSERTIAQNIESVIMTDFNTYSGGKITLLITAHLQGFRSASETRAFDIYPRPALPASEG